MNKVDNILEEEKKNRINLKKVEKKGTNKGNSRN